MTQKLTQARCLVAIIAHGVQAGDIIEADAATIKALEKEGAVDATKEAVAHAQRSGAPVRMSAIVYAEALRREQADALRVEIAKLEALRTPEADAATTQALDQKLRAAQALLAELG